MEIRIPKPCHQDWNEMLPTSAGAFCSVCSKEVIDFTQMTDHEVQQYLLDRKGTGVCGKFSNHQLTRIKVLIPENVFYSRIAGWKKFMAIFLLAFGSMLFGCDVSTEQVIKKGGHKTELVVQDSLSFKIDFSNYVGGMVLTAYEFSKPYETYGFTVTRSAETDSLDMDLSFPLPPAEFDTIPPPPTENTASQIIPVVHPDTTIIKTKLPTDTTNCGEQHFY